MNNPSLPDTIHLWKWMDDILSSITGDVPQETTNCCRIFICWMFVLWLPGPFYDCSGIGFHLFRLSVSVAKTCTFPVHSFQGIHLYLGQVYGWFAVVSSVLKPKNWVSSWRLLVCLPTWNSPLSPINSSSGLRKYDCSVKKIDQRGCYNFSGHSLIHYYANLYFVWRSNHWWTLLPLNLSINSYL